MHQIAVITAAGLIAGTLLTAGQALFLVFPAGIVLILFHLRRRAAGPAGAVWRFMLPLAALLYSSLWLHWQLIHRLPAEADRSAVVMRAVVAEAGQREQSWRLILLPQQWLSAPAALPDLRRIQLNWYQGPEELAPGSLLEVHAILRSPRSFINDLPFDYEAWLLSSGIDAGGYVRSGKVLQAGDPGLRQTLLKRVQQRTPATAWPWIAGLVFGEQDAFSAEQWRLAQQTGTLHLLVVSGLHIGLIAWAGWLLSGVLWRLLAVTAGRSVAPQQLRLLLILLLSGVYLWLAGAGIALQRAWLMILLFSLLNMSRYRPAWADILLLALVLILTVNPLLWTRPGLGFSFVAVLALISFFGGRQNSRWQALLVPQWVVFMAMLPLLMLWGQSVSLSHVVANLLAIPFVTLLLLPLAFIAALTAWAPLFSLLAGAGDVFWRWLDYINDLPWPVLYSMSPLAVLLWYGLLLLLWLGVARPVLWLTIPLMLLSVFAGKNVPRDEVRMLDVGQGLAVIFAADGHALIYDTGARFSARFSIGSAVVLPRLQKSAVRTVDELIISHSDQDHAGGAEALLAGAAGAGVTVDHIRGGQPVAGIELTLCPQHSGWATLSPNLRWRVLPLPAGHQASLRTLDNNRSCAVQLDWFGVRFLLPGDLEQDAERALVEQYGKALQSDILVVGHHGSRSSSSRAFLQAVAPQQAWISAGFNNRFGHPHADVIRRLEQDGIRWLNTADSGALLLQPGQDTLALRHGWQPPWRQP